MRVFDQNGQEKDLAWLRQEFGDVRIEGDGPWVVTELRECIGPASIQVKVLNEWDSSVQGVPIFFAWPDGIDAKTTDAQGESGFGMGRGAYYHLPGGGPHRVFVETAEKSQTIYGLGMIGGTNHRHLNVTYQYQPQPTPEEPRNYQLRSPWMTEANADLEAIDLMAQGFRGYKINKRKK